MSIATEISRLQKAKADLKLAIAAKGVTVPESAKLDEYATLVGSIQTGGSSVVTSALSVETNGSYTPPAGINGYSSVIVDVQDSETVREILDTTIVELKTAATSIYNSRLTYCSNLAKVDLLTCISLGTFVFRYDSALTTVIIRSSTVCTLSNINAFSGTPIAEGTGFIYVPRSLVSSYQNATNWSSFASCIRAIEDYPEITGG